MDVKAARRFEDNKWDRSVFNRLGARAGQAVNGNICHFYSVGRCNRKPCRFVHAEPSSPSVNRKFSKQLHKEQPRKSPSYNIRKNVWVSTESEDRIRKTRKCNGPKNSLASSTGSGESGDKSCTLKTEKICEDKNTPKYNGTRNPLASSAGNGESGDKSSTQQTEKTEKICEDKNTPNYNGTQNPLASSAGNGESGDKSSTQKTEKICEYWVSGDCVKGDNCQFLHSWFRGDGFTLLAKLDGHKKPVSGIALPLGSNKLYTGSSDGIARIWDCHTGQCISVINLGAEVGCLICEGPWVFIGMPNVIKAWNIESSAEFSIDGPAGQVYCMVVSDEMLFAGAQDGNILAWKGSSETENPFQLTASLKGHICPVTCMAVGGKRLYSGSMDNTIKVWDIKTLQSVMTLDGHTDAVMSLLCWDQYLLSCSLDRTIKVWFATDEEGNLDVAYTHKEEHISAEESSRLESVFSEEEVWAAINECDGNKAPGPDGFNLNFVKTNWETIKEDVMNFMWEFHRESSVVKYLNNTFVALIPKIRNPISIKEYRPISLVGVVYKILAKVLANRLKKVMDSIISPYQMAFVKGRQMIDSFVIEEEIIHAWRKSGEGGVLIKLDFEKAYDCVDHDFLIGVLSMMGFGSRWIGWIKSCISTVALSVLVNGSPTKEFLMEKGLRQGDPLSPFLFNMVVEVLSKLFVIAKDRGLIRGIGFNNDNVHITHLQFADDTMLFLEPKLDYLLNARRILRCFELISGLRINFFKSCLVKVGRRISVDEQWAKAFRCVNSSLPITYLGLPLGGNPRRESFWNPVLQKVKDRLAPWKRGFISKGGRLVLIKSVPSSLPTFFMSVFGLPVGVAKAIEKLQRDFFWNDGIVKRKMHAVDWDTICKNKNLGGLGIGRLRDKGLSLMAKWVWRFGKDHASLWRKVVCAKYGLKETGLVWDGFNLKSPSHFIKTINGLFDINHMSGKILKDGLKVVIGAGNMTCFWKDLRWDSVPMCVAFPRIFALASNKSGMVKDYGRFVNSKWIWEVGLRRSLFDWELVQWRCFMAALDTVIIRRDVDDALAWTFNLNGCFSVGSFRKRLESSSNQVLSEVNPLLWKGICPPKVEILLWQVFKRRVLVREVLSKFCVPNLSSLECPLCGNVSETIDHLFLLCNWSWGLWMKAMDWWNTSSCCSATIGEWGDGWDGFCRAKSKSRAWRLVFYAIVWTIWDIRNNVVFKGKTACLSMAFDSVKFKVVWWFKHFGLGSKEDITILLLDIEERCVDKNHARIAKASSWCPPGENELFFNVDGAARGHQGPAGIGGVLRDAGGKVLCLFADSIGISDPIMAEMLAIHKAAMLIASSSINPDSEITILSDSKQAVSWVNDEGFGNLNYVNLVYDIRQSLHLRKGMSIKFSPRSSNALADSLAKEGLVSGGARLEWGI